MKYFPGDIDPYPPLLSDAELAMRDLAKFAAAVDDPEFPTVVALRWLGAVATECAHGSAAGDEESTQAWWIAYDHYKRLRAGVPMHIACLHAMCATYRGRTSLLPSRGAP